MFVQNKFRYTQRRRVLAFVSGSVLLNGSCIKRATLEWWETCVKIHYQNVDRDGVGLKFRQKPDGTVQQSKLPIQKVRSVYHPELTN